MVGTQLFGYVKPFKPMLRVCEFDTYNAVYCGLCKQLSRSYGPFARLTLSYDFAFLALLDLALREEIPRFRRERCFYNPLKKKPCCGDCAPLHDSAGAAMIMLYYKALDNVRDERFPKSLAWRAALPLARRARNRARTEYGDVDDFVGEQMRLQARLEDARCDSVDEAGEPTGACLGYLFARMARQEGQRRVLQRFGYLLGRWVYMADALDDIGDDRQKGRYNPFLLRSESGAGLEELRQDAVASLNLTAGELARTFALLDVVRYGEIIGNVVDLGLRSTVERISHPGDAPGPWGERSPQGKHKGESPK